MLKNKKLLWLILPIILLIFNINGFTASYYKYTQESGTYFYVGAGDDADIQEDTNEVRQIIDDLGNEYKSKFTIQDALINILDYRYENNKPTVITSNYTLMELYEQYVDMVGEKSAAQIVSRLKTFGVIEIKGKDWRL